MKMQNKTVWGVLLSAVFVFAIMGCAEMNPATPGQIQSAIEAQNAQFQKCYEQALKRDRDAKGVVDVTVKFNPEETKPNEVSVKGRSIKDKALLKCVKNNAGKITIPEVPNAFVESTHTVVFEYK
jgi:hypothetical protein